MLKTEHWLAVAMVFIIFLLSITAGFLSPDSMNYLYMADTQGEAFLCSTNGSFNGIYACGYPLLIKLVSFITLGDLFIASKLLNVAILATSFYLFYKVFSSLKLALLLAFSSFNIFISLYTWSENIVLLSFSVYLYALFLWQKNESINFAVAALVLISILIGCLSRYAFAPFSVFMFLSSYLVVGKKSYKVLPFFIIPAVIFISYKLSISQYDMERIPAPESMALIIGVFIMACLKSVLKTVLALSPFFIVNYKKISWQHFKEKVPPFALFFIASGVGYLAVSFTLRSLVQYDFFVNRMIGFGIFLIVSGVLITFKDLVEKTKPKVIITTLVLTFLVAVGSRASLSNMVNNEPYFLTEGIDEVIEGNRVYGEVIVPIGYSKKSRPHKAVVLSQLEYDNPEATFKLLPGRPYFRPVDDKEFSSMYSGVTCTLSFAPSLTIEQLDILLSESYQVTFTEYVPAYHPKLKEYILNKFKQGDTSC